jgi:hypothetical protein
VVSSEIDEEETHKIVMKTANQTSCALIRECVLVCHSPRLMS